MPKGGGIGIFTPSRPAHTRFRARFATAIAHIENLGFRVVLGTLTSTFQDQGYRTAVDIWGQSKNY